MLNIFVDGEGNGTRYEWNRGGPTGVRPNEAGIGLSEGQEELMCPAEWGYIALRMV